MRSFWRAFILVVAIPGLLALDVPSSSARPLLAQVTVDPPRQMSGSAAGLAHMVDTSATQPNHADDDDMESVGPARVNRVPKGALPRDDREYRSTTVSKPGKSARAPPPAAMGSGVARAEELGRIAMASSCDGYTDYSSTRSYTQFTVVVYQTKKWRATRSVPAGNAPSMSSTYWEYWGECSTPAHPPTIVDAAPDDQVMVDSLTPLLMAYARSNNGTYAIDYSFTVCRHAGMSDPGCVSSGYLLEEGRWRVPVGFLAWGKQYWWRVTAKDRFDDSTTERTQSFVVGVRQPVLTSQLSAQGVNGQEFHQLAGNYTTTFTDASVPTAGPPLSVVRSYNSMDPRNDGIFGAGWSTRWDMKASLESAADVDTLLITYPDGQQVRFAAKGDGTFQPPSGVHATLAEALGGGWRLMDKSSTSYLFDAQGRLTQVTDNRNRAQTLAYGPGGKLVTVTGTGGRSLHFTWSGAHVASVSTDPVNSTALTWTYTYEGNKLTAVCSPVQQPNCVSYAYGTGSQYRSTVLDSDPNGYWRLGESSGTWAADLGWGAGNAEYDGVTLGGTGALGGTSDTSASFNGGQLELPANVLPRLGDDLSFETWFKTTQSGVLLSGTYITEAPLLYVGLDGKLRAQVETPVDPETEDIVISPITTSAPVNNGQWRHVVVTSTETSTKLYLDGALVGTLDFGGQNFWREFARVGNGMVTTGSWPSTPTSSSWAVSFPFRGSLDEIALYDKPLTPAEIQAHFQARAEVPHKLTRVTLPSGRVWAQNVYDAGTDRLKTHTDQHGGTWQLGAPVYNAGTGISTVTVTDPHNGTLIYDHDAWRGYRLVKSEDQRHEDTYYLYDTGGYLNSVIDRNGNTTERFHDERGNLIGRKTCRTAGSCQTEHFAYYVNTNDVFDPRNDQLLVHRDARSSSATDDTYATKWEYNTYGDLTKETGPATSDFPNGRSLTYAYTDGTEPAAGGGTTPAGLLKSEKDAKGNETFYKYTAAGDLAEHTTPAGLVNRYTFDAIGRPSTSVEVSDAHPSGVTTAFTYDGLSRLIAQTGAGVRNEVTNVTHTAEVRRTYDADGNRLTDSVVDLTGGDPERKITYTYDDYGRVETVTGPEGAVVGYAWDHTGARTSVTDELGVVFHYAYTPRGELASRTIKNWTGSPVAPQPPQDVVLESYSYDPEGRVATQVDVMGRKVSYTYYGDDRLWTAYADDVRLNGSATPRDVVLESDTYDAAGYLTRQVTGGGKATTDYVYDAAGRLTSEAFDPSSLNRRLAYAYDANANVTRVTATGAGSSRVEVTELAYNELDQVVRSTVDNGDHDIVTTWSIDDRGLVTARTSPRGNAPGVNSADFTSDFRYDMTGRLVEHKAPQVSVESTSGTTTARPTTKYGYDSASRQTHVVDSEGRTYTTNFDRVDRVTSVVAPAYTPPGGTAVTPRVSYAYDPAGRLTSLTDERGFVTTVEHDALGRQIRVTDPAPVEEQARGAWVTEYDLAGEVLALVDPTGARVQSTYDDLGRPITSTEIERRPTSAAHTTAYEFDDAGYLTKETAPGNKVTGFVVNAAGEVTRETNPLGKFSVFAYDLAGRAVKGTDPLGNASVTEYDLAGRPTTAKHLDDTGAILRSFGREYDADSNVIFSTSAEGFVTTREYDPTGLLTRLVEPVSASEQITTTYGYDATGALTRTTDGRGNTVRTTYNTLGFIESVVEPETSAYPDLQDRTWTNVYDIAGNEVATLQPGGVRIDREFDRLGRVVRETGSGAPVATPERVYGYDLAGRLTAVGDYTLEYNDRDHLTKVSKPSGQVAAFAYDALGNPTQRVDATGTAAFTWDGNDRLATAADPVSGRSFTYGYDDADRLTSLISASPATTQTFGYDGLDRLKTHALKNSAGTELAKITYGWDKDDHLTSKTTTGTAGAGANTYGYDRAGRLTSWTAPGGATTPYTWDASGNRTRAGTQDFLYDQRNRLLSGAGTTYAYSARGTLDSETTSAGTRTLVFDAFDRMVSDGDATYSYDALGRLASRVKGGTEQRFVYSGLANDVAQITDGAGVVQAKYGRDPFGALISVHEGGQAAGVMSDVHDDVVATFSGTALVDSVAYSPFGEVTHRVGSPRALGYQGEYTDPDTGKINMHARWYLPGTGGFASRDSVTLNPDPSSNLNRYPYVNGDPLGDTDSSGNFPDKGSGPKGPPVQMPVGAYAKTNKELRQIHERGRRYDREQLDKQREREKSYKRYKKRKRDERSGDSVQDEKKQMRNRRKPPANDRDRTTAEKREMRNHKKPPPNRRTKRQDETRKVKAPRSGSRNNPKSVKNPPATKKTKGNCTGTKCPKNSKSEKNTDKAGQFCQKAGNAKKPQCKNNANHEYGGGKKPKPKKSKEERYDDIDNLPDLCRTNACRNSVTPISPKGGKRDVVDDIEDLIDLVDPTTQPDDIVDQIIDDAAPDLPSGIPPGGGESCNPNSFVSGTLVLMADGSRKRIEDVKVGDRVLATDPEAGVTDAKPVVTLITGEGTKRLVRITVDIDGDRGAATDTLTATDGHPFWVPKLRKWLTAGELKPGMWLQTSAGTWVQITSVKVSTTHRRVHNLTVSGLHTYHVVVGGRAVLVHNDDPLTDEECFALADRARDEERERMSKTQRRKHVMLVGVVDCVTGRVVVGKKRSGAGDFCAEDVGRDDAVSNGSDPRNLRYGHPGHPDSMKDADFCDRCRSRIDPSQVPPDRRW
ncbi:hypothetical protein Ssi03_54520 [Sphaerisporangium siamense]|nr:hypothetical protein Ssi03_54520 [Sphaerisporangium siamense]